MHKSRAGFTLVEVLIAVVIISIVIMSLLQMYANNVHIFSSIKQKTDVNKYASFFISNPDMGLENKSITIYDLLDDFDLDDDLRRELKNIKAKIIYQELEVIDMSDFEDDDSLQEDNSEENKKEVNSNMVIEIGKTILRLNNSSTALLRLRSQ